MPYILTVSVDFDAAHYLRDYDGPCGNLHGHTWAVEVSWSFVELQPDGMAEDFKVLKQRVKAILPDHQVLNEALPFNPTAENIARWLCEELNARSVRVWEGRGSCAEFARE